MTAPITAASTPVLAGTAQVTRVRAWTGIVVAVVMAGAVGASVTWLLADDRVRAARTEAIQAQETAATSAAKSTVEPGPLDLPASIDALLPILVARAKAKPGTAAALGMLEVSGRFDAVRANLLIAKDLPECAHLNLAEVNAWYAAAARLIQARMDFCRAQPEWQTVLAGSDGEANFRMSCADFVLSTHLGIGYVDHDIVRYDLPWHIFAHGIPQHRKGNCLTLALAWKMIADKLEWPMTLRALPGHSYLRWSDAQSSFNVEVTNGAQKLPDEAYTVPYGITPDDRAKGYWMRDLSPKDMLALFIGSRGGHYAALKQKLITSDPQAAYRHLLDALGDALLAQELDPLTQQYTSNAANMVAQVVDFLFERSQAALTARFGESLDAIHARNQRYLAATRRLNAIQAEHTRASLERARAGAATPTVPVSPQSSPTAPVPRSP